MLSDDASADQVADQVRHRLRDGLGILDGDSSPGNWYISGYSYGFIDSPFRPDWNISVVTPEHKRMWMMGYEDGQGDRNG